MGVGRLSIATIALHMLFLGTLAKPTSAQITYRTVGVAGDPAPGQPPGTTVGLGFNNINNAGDLAFEGWIELPDGSCDFATWVETSGVIELVAKTGDPLPGLPDEVAFTYSFEPKINSQGHIAFLADLEGPIFPRHGIWSGPPGQLHPVLLEDSQIPGELPGMFFGRLNHQNIPNLGGGGHVTAWTGITGKSVDSTNDTGVWRYGDGTFELLVREGDPAPGTGEGVVFADFDSTIPDVNADGHIAFVAEVMGPGISGANSLGIWSDVAGQLECVMLGGDPAPGMGPDVTLGAPWIPSLNNSGQILFRARLNGPQVSPDSDAALWMAEGDSLSLVAREGDQPTGGMPPNISVGNVFDFYAVNEGGRIGFKSRGSLETIAIWVRDDQSLRVVAPRGMRAPGTPEDVVFGSFDHLSINARGQIAFVATVSGPGVNNDNRRGAWATDLNGNLHLIVRAGDSLEPILGVNETIRFFDTKLYSGGEDGRDNSFNDRGEVAFWASWRDSSGIQSGVFVASTIPDSDGDGIPDDDDTCPDEDATDLDANGDGCLDQAAGLTALIQDEMDLPLGIESALIRLAQSAAASQESGQRQAAANQLQGLVKLIEAQKGKAIPEQGAQLLLEFIQNAASQL